MMKSKIKLSFLAIAASISVSSISGCTSTGANGERISGVTGSVSWYKNASMQTKVNHFKPDCLAYGFKDGTPEMSQCLQSAIQDGEAAIKQKVKDMYD